MVFSIIIPVYNVEKYIEKCLDSVVKQDFDSFEIIVVNDGSTDCSRKICDEYADKYSKVTVIHQENGGLAAARNTGLRYAEGDWILFVDSDDWIAQGMLKELYAQMVEVDADIYTYNAYVTDEVGEVEKKLIFSPENRSFLFYDEKARFEYFVELLMQYKVGWEAWSRVYKRSIIEAYGMQFQSCEEVFAEDYLFSFQYMFYVKKVVHLCNLFYYYRQRQNSLIHSIEQNSIIRRLYRWTEYAFEMMRRADLRFCLRHFYMLYFMLFNYHFQNMLSEMETKVMNEELESLSEHKRHRGWMKQMRKHRAELSEYMRIKKWL